jgi:hypothetical protein
MAGCPGAGRGVRPRGCMAPKHGSHTSALPRPRRLRRRYLPCRPAETEETPWHRTLTPSPSKPAPSPVRLPERPEPDAAPSRRAWLPVRVSHRSPWPWPPSSPVTRTATSGSGSPTRRPSGIHGRRPPIGSRRLAGCLVAPSSNRRVARPTHPIPSSFRGPDASPRGDRGRPARFRPWMAVAGAAFRAADLRPAPGRKLSPPGAGRWHARELPRPIRVTPGVAHEGPRGFRPPGDSVPDTYSDQPKRLSLAITVSCRFSPCSGLAEDRRSRQTEHRQRTHGDT